MTMGGRLLELLAAIRTHHHYHDVRPVPEPIPVQNSPSLDGRQVACVVLAGGQATRLGSALPKGVIPFTPKTNKPLLQLIAEKVALYSRRHKIPSRLIVMTSEATDDAIRALFANDRFGLDHIDFVVQPSLPLLDMEGEIAKSQDRSILTGPDGNGSVFRCLADSSLLDQVEAVSIIMVDNPLFDPCDPSLLIPIFEGFDCTAAAIERVDPSESVGIFVLEGQRIKVIEYTELNEDLREKRDESGRLLFRFANISAFGCSPRFIKAAAALHLPIHPAKKTVSGQQIWKGETFIFDALPAARTIRIVLFDRATSFAPIKDKASFEKAKQLWERSLLSSLKNKVYAAVKLFEAEGKNAFPVLKDLQGPFGPTPEIGCIGIHHLAGRMVLHPLDPSMEGKLLLNAQDEHGFLYVQAMNRVIETRGEGWVFYTLKNSKKQLEEQKVSFIKHAKWEGEDYFLGCGIFGITKDQVHSIFPDDYVYDESIRERI